MAVRKVKEVSSPKGFARFMWRAPIIIYHLGLGGLLKNRFLLLHHTGRKTGKPRENVLEIVDRDSEKGVYYIASGFGKKSDWYKNLRKNPDALITVGRQDIPVTAVFLSPDESGKKMVEYAHHNPKAAQSLSKIMGFEVDDTDQDYYEYAHDYVPWIALTPRI
jgi:deazaflavin-dependent oxidoreductase (nitroreductase family)